MRIRRRNLIPFKSCHTRSERSMGVNIWKIRRYELNLMWTGTIPNRGKGLIGLFTKKFKVVVSILVNRIMIRLFKKFENWSATLVWLSGEARKYFIKYALQYSFSFQRNCEPIKSPQRLPFFCIARYAIERRNKKEERRKKKIKFFYISVHSLLQSIM